MERAQSDAAALRQQLADSRAAAERTAQRNADFLSMLSHELRNPLAAMLNALQLCELASADQTTFEWSRIIMRRQLTHLTRIVDDLLDMTAITSGAIELRPEVIDAADVLDRLVERLKPLFLERRQQLDVSYPRAQLIVSADAARLEQVIANLLTNAAKYTQAGGSISLSARHENSEIVFVVRDNGLGIAPDLLAELFDLFAHARRSTARAQGLGLGLSIARALVQMHGGTIAVASDGEGRGAEFVVRLPAATAKLSPPDERPAERHAHGRRRGVRILVVEDHADTAASLARLLRGRGNAVEIATDGPTALEGAASFRPEVVLLDLGLPGMNGYEVAKQMREKENGSRATIIAISGFGQEQDRQRSREAGIDYHLVKPVSFDALDELLAATAEQAARS